MSLFSPREQGSPNTQRYIWLDYASYNSEIVRESSTDLPCIRNPGVWDVGLEKQKIEWRGINFKITVRNKSQSYQAAPYVRINSGMYHATWENAGSFSYWRHARNCTNHDSFGMRFESISDIGNAAIDKFGNVNAIYGYNWFSPCLTIDNYVTNRFVSDGMQMMSVSTNYEFPFKIYGEYDAATLEAYFRIDGNVNVPNVGIVDKFAPGEVRTWQVWLRFENYNSRTLYDTPISRAGSPTYRKVAALRSYEPYYVWFWNNRNHYNHGARISGRIYGIRLAGRDAPTSYFASRDNPRRYYLFSKNDKQNLFGQLPLPGQTVVHPQKVSGWKELLDNIVDVGSLQQYGYKAVMLFNISGWGNNDNGGNPSHFSNLPINLRNTLSELKTWEKNNGIRILFAADNALNKVNTGYYYNNAVDFDTNNSEHLTAINNNFINGSFLASSGTALLDLPSINQESYVEEYLSVWRNRFPSISLMAENRQENALYNYAVPTYIDRYEFLTRDYSKGGRDWFLDLLFPGHDPVVYMPLSLWYADYGNLEQTRDAYDAYAQYIEEKHQAVIVTIDRLVKKTCKYPNKLNWKDDFTSYVSFGFASFDNICRAGDPVLNRKLCLPTDIIRSYSNSPPSFTDMIGLYQFDAYYDWSLPGNTKHSWVPFGGGSGDYYANVGDAAIWLYQDDKLSLAKQTLANNINGVNRPDGRYIPSGYSGDIFHNMEFSAYTTSNSIRPVPVGYYLDMFDLSDTVLIRPSDGSSLEPRTLRSWWIWVHDSINPGWANGKNTEQINEYLQSTWVERWRYWINELNATIRQVMPTIKKIGCYNAVPEYGRWQLGGLFFGKLNPDVENTSREKEIAYWKPFIEILDYISPALYPFQPTANYDAPLQITDTGRYEADPIQERLFYLLSLREYNSVAKAVSKPFYLFQQSTYIRTYGGIQQQYGDFLYRSVYTSGAQGIILWSEMYGRSLGISIVQRFENLWYNAARFIETRTNMYKVEITPPIPLGLSNFEYDDLILSIDPNSGSIPGFDGKIPVNQQSSNFLAKFGKYSVKNIFAHKNIIKNPNGEIPSSTRFDISNYKAPISGGVYDKFAEDYSRYYVVAEANSVNGVFKLAKPLTKYNDVAVSIRNTSFVNTYSPHDILEDTFEWVNSGMPSHLSQVHHSNIVSAGLATEFMNPHEQEDVVPAYQSRYVIPDNNNFYDKTNSTIDYIKELEYANQNVFLPYPNSVLFVADLGLIFIGGYNGLLSIDVENYEISKIDLPTNDDFIVKDLRKFDNVIYILTEKKIYFYNIQQNKITIDITFGLPSKLYCVTKTNNNSIVIGAQDGIYSRLYDAEYYTKVLSTDSAVLQMISPDAFFAVTNNLSAYSSVDGFAWKNVGKFTNINSINHIYKFRSNIYLATNDGLYVDDASFYTNKALIRKINIQNLGTNGGINHADINAQYMYFGDAKPTTYVDGITNEKVVKNYCRLVQMFSKNDVIFLDTKLQTIHKIVLANNKIFMFGFDSLQIYGSERVYKLATGTRI